MDVETFVRLLEPAGQALLAEVHARTGVESDLALGTRLRREHDVALVAAAVSQNHLRGLARAKFAEGAAAMYATHDALQQATRGRVAAHRAKRLVAAGVSSVLDLGCGIGGDLLACARAGLRVTGVEADPVRAAIARANLAAAGLEGEVLTADAVTEDTGGHDAVFCDPARRDGRGRVFDPDTWSPPWGVVAALLRGAAVVKTAPGIPHSLVPSGVEAEFVSDGGDLVEAALWGGPLASTARRASVLPGDEQLSDTDEPAVAATGPVAAYLYEPDDAVIRAGLVAAFAHRIGGHLLDPHIAYVGAGELVPTSLARAYVVRERLPFREKQLKAALRERDVGTLTIKKRGVDVVPDVLRRRLRMSGSVPATLVVTRVGGTGCVLLVEPVPPFHAEIRVPGHDAPAW
ncbi:MAG: class I SAM-dependent methyltransferase [Actinomycetota bacterium]|nr:class I SAM-dependent methyltransferase [Actinomycetota bacterium]